MQNTGGHLKQFIRLAHNSRGMSLIEILVALTLLAFAGTFVGSKIYERLHEGRVNSTKIQMQNLSERLEDFRRHCNFYPTTDQGLEALIEKPTTGRECKKYAPGGYIKNNQLPLDPWGYDFIYESDGKTFNIKSLGADGQDGGDGTDADINLRENKREEI